VIGFFSGVKLHLLSRPFAALTENIKSKWRANRAFGVERAVFGGILGGLSGMVGNFCRGVGKIYHQNNGRFVVVVVGATVPVALFLTLFFCGAVGWRILY